MENQPRKISGYRELSELDIDMINRVKAAGDELLALQQEIMGRLDLQKASKGIGDGKSYRQPTPDEVAEYERFNAAEPHRWAAIGKTDIQTGVMALVRAIAQPTGA